MTPLGYEDSNGSAERHFSGTIAVVCTVSTPNAIHPDTPRKRSRADTVVPCLMCTGLRSGLNEFN